MDPVTNFAKVKVSTGYDASATSIVLESGHGTKLPQPSTDGEFNLIWWNFTDYKNPSDDPNVEIIRVTARSTDTLTVTRAQEGISASTKNTGGKEYFMILGITKKMIDDIKSSKVDKTELDAKAPTASPTFTGTITLADNARIDLTLPTADTYVTGNTTDSFASGYSSAVGDLVFFGSGGKWLEVDADAVATCKGMMGIALEAKTDGQAMLVALPGSFVRLDSWNWTAGDTLYAGETPGAIQNTIPTGADAIIRVIGFAVSADVIYFMPSSDQQSTVA